ncbi:hypothetical protein ACJX0J_039279 [Zea mays]
MPILKNITTAHKNTITVELRGLQTLIRAVHHEQASQHTGNEVWLLKSNILVPIGSDFFIVGFNLLANEIVHKSACWSASCWFAHLSKKITFHRLLIFIFLNSESIFAPYITEVVDYQNKELAL